MPTKVAEKICQHKMASGCMLLTMETMCQNTCCNEKRPEPFQEMSGSMVFKAQSNFFLEFRKKKLFTKIVTLKMTIKKYFFFQKNLSKKFANKSRRENLSTQNGIRVHATGYEIYM